MIRAAFLAPGPGGPETAGRDRAAPGAGVAGLRAGTARRGRLLVAPGALCAALACWVVALRTAQGTTMSDLGLASVLRAPYWLALGLLALAFAFEVAGTAREWVLLGATCALVVVLFGTASAVEPVARVATAWYIAGFVNYVAAHGHVLNGFDARFSWPAFFAYAAMILRAAGEPSATALLRWAPVVFELVYLAPLRMLAGAAGVSRRAGWIGTALFYAANFVEQDYFSPQAFADLFLLVLLAAVLAFWARGVRDGDETTVPLRHPGLARRLGRRLSLLRRPPAVPLLDGGRRQLVLALVVAMCAAAVVSHQLTPYALVLGFVVLFLSGRQSTPYLALLVLVTAAGWLGLAATNFWVNHLDLVFGGTGNIGAALHQNVSGRVTGAAMHRHVVDLRLGLAVAVAVLALAGALRRRGERTVEALAAYPFLLLGAQSYGGEAVLRCFLYALPFLALLAGSFLASLLAGRPAPAAQRPPPGGRSRRERLRRPLGALAVGCVLFGCAGWLSVVRGGNDPYEAFTSGERAAVLDVYRLARRGDGIAVLESLAGESMPWRDEGLGSYRYLDADVTGGPTGAARSLLAQHPRFVILTGGVERWGELVEGWPRGWERGDEQVLLRARFRVQHSWPTATVLEADGP
jgi:hypothetical protein